MNTLMGHIFSLLKKKHFPSFEPKDNVAVNLELYRTYDKGNSNHAKNKCIIVAIHPCIYIVISSSTPWCTCSSSSSRSTCRRWTPQRRTHRRSLRIRSTTRWTARSLSHTLAPALAPPLKTNMYSHTWLVFQTLINNKPTQRIGWHLYHMHVYIVLFWQHERNGT